MSPFRSVSFRFVPFRSVPFRSVPFRSVPLRSIPFRVPIHPVWLTQYESESQSETEPESESRGVIREESEAVTSDRARGNAAFVTGHEPICSEIFIISV